MKKPGLWSMCVLMLLPLVLAGPTCECPIKRMLAPEKCKPATSAQPTASHASASHAPASHAPAKATARPVSELPAPATLAEAVSRARTQHKAIYLEFSAGWCIPCRLYKANVLSSEGGKEALRHVVFFPVNVDKSPELANRFDVSAVPTGLLLQPGANGSDVRVVNRHVGTLSLDKLRTFLGQAG